MCLSVFELGFLTGHRLLSNCRFGIDDFEQPWEYSRPFDYIHGRELEGFVRDYDKLFQQALKNLKPGGYFEIASIEVTTLSDDGTHLNAKNYLEGFRLAYEASEKFGKSMRTVSTWKEKMIKAGFQDVHEKVFKVTSLLQNPVLSFSFRIV